MSDNSVLFQPFDLGNLQLANRVVMAPMTRNL
jgi:2,4-dienoyl-CoA reductase-like NADH-dependent reductase (Old Yellow Enzyme family)